MRRFWLNALRSALGLYPFQIGKGWVARLFRDQDIPQGEIVRTKDNVLVCTKPDYAFKYVYLFKEFEPVNVPIFKRLIHPGDICVDAGANFGYYTCLFARWGAKRVYAFKPVTSTYALNQENVRLNRSEERRKNL